mgnify:CR=1 FL=1
MGEAQSYSVQATETPEPTLEDAANAIDEAEAQQLEAEQNREPQTYTPERPEWLPEKFESAEAMAQAYAELETKLGNPEAQPTETETKEEASEYDNTIEGATIEFQEKGELSEETYKALEKQGLNKIMVDNYIAGQEAIIAQQQMEITSEIGGMQEYQKLSNWAAETLSDDDLQAYNETVESGTVAQAKFALKSLYAQFQAAGSPKIAQGSVNGTGVPPFQSRQQVTMAMRDPRYDKDPAYRDEVLQRLARSNV